MKIFTIAQFEPETSLETPAYPAPQGSLEQGGNQVTPIDPQTLEDERQLDSMEISLMGIGGGNNVPAPVTAPNGAFNLSKVNQIP